MKISICIPTWEQFGKGANFLSKNLEMILNQTYKNFNVIISDHSKNDEIKNICKKYSNFFELKYYRNDINLGNSPHNTNNAIKKADGEIVKIIFQDDFLYTDNSLEMIVDAFNIHKCFWLVNGSNHTYDDGKSFVNTMIPRWNDEIIFGVNTISSPSVLSFLNTKPCLFDEQLTMLMDCEMYYQLYKKYGQPIIISETLTTNRMHEHQISNMYNKNILDEIVYVKKKHKII